MTRLTKTYTKGSWRIEGTDLALRRSREHGDWTMTVLTRDREPVLWLSRHGLLHARARTRRDLLRAYEAAAAVSCPPRERLPVPLKRLGPGFYAVPGAGITVTRIPEGWWVEVREPRMRHLVPNLSAARELIRLRHHELLAEEVSAAVQPGR